MCGYMRFLGHLCYLTDEYVVLSLFDPVVTDAVADKAEMA